MVCRELGKYVLVPCCFPDTIIELCIERDDIPLANGVYLYTGLTTDLLTNGTCYTLEFFPEPTGPNDGPLIPADFQPQLDCNTPECDTCTYVLKFVSCCTSEEIYFTGNISFNTNDVLQYTGELPFEGFGGSLTPDNCYTVVIFTAEVDYPSIDPIQDNLSLISTDCNDPLCEPCVENVSYTVENCLDSELTFSINVVEGGFNINDVIGLNINPGDEIVSADDNLCITEFTISHPDINSGDSTPYNGIAYKQPTLYNGKPYYLFTLTETEHGVPGLILNFYFLWNTVENRWEIWPEFNPFTGPSNSACSENVPFMVLTNILGESCVDPVTSNSCSYCNSCTSFDVSTCLYFILTARDVVFCSEAETIGDFINCWKVIDIIPYSEVYPVFEVTENFENCEECLEVKNTPPCIKLTDCQTGTVIYLTSTETLLEYIGKVIKVQLGIYEKCYTVALSEICPEEPAVLPGIIIDCYKECKDCVPPCTCTRARNNSSSPKRLEYLDCNNVIRETEEVVGVGRLSQKYCVYRWISEQVEVIQFGNCIDNECPEIPRPKRVVTPGYNTPICTPEHYERIVCRYAENKYRDVMEERFGIANCCPDESLPNDIKYELIHLQMLLDPDYECMSDPNPCNCHGTGSLTVREINCNS